MPSETGLRSPEIVRQNKAALAAAPENLNRPGVWKCNMVAEYLARIPRMFLCKLRGGLLSTTPRLEDAAALPPALRIRVLPVMAGAVFSRVASQDPVSGVLDQR